MYRMADQPEEPNVLGTVAMGGNAGVGAAVVGYTGYMIGTELYLEHCPARWCGHPAEHRRTGKAGLD